MRFLGFVVKMWTVEFDEKIRRNETFFMIPFYTS